jgi:fructose-bisphosphate aldolase class II
MKRAYAKSILVPLFDVPYVPVLKPIVETLVECETFGLVGVARVDIERFGAQSLEVVAREYRKYEDQRYTRLHLDHVPVIDEDFLQVDWKSWIQKGIALKYDSVMIDGSRLPLAENIRITREVVKMAHEHSIPVEAELGAVLGHERKGVHLTMSYQEIYDSGFGFTDPEQAKELVEKTQVDWLSVAIGNIHGAVSGVAKDEDKVETRLNIGHLKKLKEKTLIPLVLHGGTGIKAEYVMEATKNGITKINIGTEIRHTYERALRSNSRDPRQEVASRVRALIQDVYHLQGTAHKI